MIAGTDYTTGRLDDLIEPLYSIKEMYTNYEITPYHASKISTHPFFNGQSALALEPLSLVYNAISKDKSLLRKIAVVSIEDSPLKLSYSPSKYASIYSQTRQLDESILFLDFFFSEQEVWKRYINMNLPIIVTSLKEAFIQDNNFNNKQIISYIEEAFHHPISLEMPNFLNTLDRLYEETLHN